VYPRARSPDQRMSQTQPRPDVIVYGPEIPWEIPVQLCLRDFIEPGDVVFDVGANIGGVAIALSRFVGPNGRVHAFEANPLLLARLRQDLDANHASNVVVVPRGVWSRSGEELAFFCDPSYYASASSFLRPIDGWQQVTVHTVTLDDYVELSGAYPRAIKIDVEGAEFEVLSGARNLIEKHRPVVVLEYYPSPTAENDPTEYLRSVGYSLFDTNLYQPVSRDWYLTTFAKPPLVNVLAVPAWGLASGYDKLRLTEPSQVRVRAPLESDAFELSGPGRYRVDARMSGPAQTIAKLQVAADDAVLVFYQGPVEMLQAHSCSSMILQLDRNRRVRCRIEAEDTRGLRLEAVEVRRITGLPTRS
jgi:FkbM family methyltransferase